MSRITYPGKDDGWLTFSPEETERWRATYARVFPQFATTRGDIIPGVNDDVVKSNVLSFLGPSDRLRAAVTSKSMRNALGAPRLTFEQALQDARDLLAEVSQITEQYEPLARRCVTRYKQLTRMLDAPPMREEDARAEKRTLVQQWTEYNQILNSTECYGNPAIIALALTGDALAAGKTSLYTPKDAAYEQPVMFLRAFRKPTFRQDSPETKAANLILSDNSEMLRNALAMLWQRIATSRLYAKYPRLKIRNENDELPRTSGSDFTDIVQYFEKHPELCVMGPAYQGTWVPDYLTRYSWWHWLDTLEPICDIDDIVVPLGKCTFRE